MALYAIRLRENGGFFIEQITNWAKWQVNNITDIKSECRPVFLDKMPDPYQCEPQNAVVLINGSVIMPRPVETVINYVLPNDIWI